MPNYPTIEDKKIEYNSPSGFVHIGKYIPPFEEVKDGFGYKGILLEDFESGKLQCHICGEWLDQMGSHLRKHNINSREYKLKFGLLLQTALKSKKMRLNQSKIMIELRRKNKVNRLTFKRNNLFAGNRKDKPKALESRNKFGVCDLQIKDRIIQLRDELGKTPTLIDLKNRYGWGFVTLISSRYESYIKYCQKNGFIPNYSNFNPKYSKEYFIEKGLSSNPSIKILTIPEGRALYRYFKSVKEWKEAVEKYKMENIKDDNN